MYRHQHLGHVRALFLHHLTTGIDKAVDGCAGGSCFGIGHHGRTLATTAAAAAPTRFQFESISSRAVEASRLASSHAAMSGLR